VLAVEMYARVCLLVVFSLPWVSGQAQLGNATACYSGKSGINEMTSGIVGVNKLPVSFCLFELISFDFSVARFSGWT
jgi:hypothetical protein